MIIRYLVSFYSTKRDGGGNPVADIWLALLENDDTVIKELTPGTSQADALSAIAADLAIAYPSDTLELTGVVEDSISDIQIELAGKAELVHTHAQADVTGLSARLDDLTTLEGTVAGHTTAIAGKAATVHGHVGADITDLDDVVTQKVQEAQSAHSHNIGDVLGLTSVLDGKADDAHEHTLSITSSASSVAMTVDGSSVLAVVVAGTSPAHKSDSPIYTPDTGAASKLLRAEGYVVRSGTTQRHPVDSISVDGFGGHGGMIYQNSTDGSIRMFSGNKAYAAQSYYLVLYFIS